MDLFDIVGPIMVGPSSSHTAGAVRMGYVAGKLLGEPIQKAEILLYGSFLATGEGHGTRKAIVAGLLGMQTDDYQTGRGASEYGSNLSEWHQRKADGGSDFFYRRFTDQH